MRLVACSRQTFRLPVLRSELAKEKGRSLARTNNGDGLSSYVMNTGTTNLLLERRVRELLLLQETAKR